MRKLTYFTIFLLAVTLAMLFYVKNTRGKEYNTPLLSTPSRHEVGIKRPTRGRGSNEPYLKVSFLNIGQGDASFIEWPNGEQMLVDCAKDATVLGALGRVMKYYDKEIDYLVITHPDLDHYGGCIDVLKRFDVKNIIYTGLQKEDKSWRYLWDMIQKENAQYTEISKQSTRQIDNSTINFLFPDKNLSETGVEKDNNASIVFKLSYGENDILFMGDAEMELEEYLVNKYGDILNAEVLKVGHHGSGSSSGQNFTDIVSPDFSMISVGKDNDYGHPSRRVLKRLERVGGKIWRTDEHGDIIVQVGKNSIEIK